MQIRNTLQIQSGILIRNNKFLEEESNNIKYESLTRNLSDHNIKKVGDVPHGNGKNKLIYDPGTASFV